MILAAEDDIEVVGEAVDGLQAVELAERQRPDHVLMGIRMPRLDGLEALRRLTRPGLVDPPKVVVVTTFEDDEYVHRALRDGACGFLIKDSDPALLVEAIRAAASGEALVSPSITHRLLRGLPARLVANGPVGLSPERATRRCPPCGDDSGGTGSVAFEAVAALRPRIRRRSLEESS